MTKVSASEFAEMSAALLRFAEAKYLFEQFKAARSSEINQGLFLLTVYFDSFLFCLVSVEEMVDSSARDKLRVTPSFLFFKALRNITTHHSVLSGLKGKFPRPISRIVSIGVGYKVDFPEQFFLLPERLREIFDRILLERPNEKRTITAARSYLDRLETAGNQIMITDLMESVLTDVEPHVS